MTDDAGTILGDVPNSTTGFDNDDAVVAAFLKLDEDETSLSEADDNATEPSNSETEDNRTTTEEHEEHSSGDETKQARLASDDDEIEIKVGDETKRVKAADLKRLFGQEASLTKKSQEVAEARKQADLDAQRATSTLNKMIARAEEEFAPFADPLKCDWIALSHQLPPDQYAALRADAQQKLSNLNFLRSELDGHTRAAAENARIAHQKAAAKAVEVLSDPKTGIEGWGDKLYGEIISFGVEAGGNRDELLGITDPFAIKVLHDAMRFRKGQKAATEKVTKVVNKPSKVLRSGSANSPSAETTSKREAMALLRKTGSTDAAAAAFMATFRTD